MSDDGDEAADADAHRGGGRRTLSEEDRRLWEHVVRSVTPVRRVARDIEVPPRPLAPRNVEAKADPRAELQRRLEQGTGYVGADAEREPKVRVTPTPHRPPPVSEFDRKAIRRLRSGRIEIESRIDLHGMRQDEAYATLRRFLVGCHQRGVRWALVITGKGRPLSASAESGETSPGRSGRHASRRQDPVPAWRDEERGVLKRSVPRWLAEPELRAIVVSYTTASPSHGGEGALYVHLRARR